MGYSIQWEENGVVTKYFGELTSGEVVESVVSKEADARFDSLRFAINDFLDVQDVACEQGDIDLIGAHDIGASVTNPNIKVAMVTRQPEVIDWVRRYLQASGEVFPTRVFATVAEARTWVEVSGA